MDDVTLYTVRQFSEKQPALTPGSLRWQLFHRETNGLKKAGAVIQVGHRVLIVGEKYLAWLIGQPTVAPPQVAPRPPVKAAARARKVKEKVSAIQRTFQKEGAK